MAKKILKCYKSRHSIAAGSILIVAGVLSICSNIVDFFMVMEICGGISSMRCIDNHFFYTGHGIWTGAVSVVVGGMAIGAGKNKNGYLILVLLIMAVILGLLSLAQLGLAVRSAEAIGRLAMDQFCSSKPAFEKPCALRRASFAMEVILAFLGLVICILCIWLVVLCARSIRACRQKMAQEKAKRAKEQRVSSRPKRTTYEYDGQIAPQRIHQLRSCPPAYRGYGYGRGHGCYLPTQYQMDSSPRYAYRSHPHHQEQDPYHHRSYYRPYLTGGYNYSNYQCSPQLYPEYPDHNYGYMQYY